MGKAKMENAQKPEAPKYKNTAPTFASSSNLDLCKWACVELGEAEAKSKNVYNFLIAAYPGEKISENSVSQTTGKARAEVGFSPLRNSNPDTAPTTRTTKVSNNASTTDVVSCVITLQGMLKDSDYDNVKATIQEVAKLLNKIGEGEALKLLDALAGRSNV